MVMEEDKVVAMDETASRNKITSQNTRISRDMVNFRTANQQKEIYSKVNEAFRRKANETQMLVKELERVENKTMLEIEQMEMSIQSLREANMKVVLPRDLNAARIQRREKLAPTESEDQVQAALIEEKSALDMLALDASNALQGSKEMLSYLSTSLEKVGSALLDKREGYYRDLEALGMSPGHEGKNVTIYQPAPPAVAGFGRSISPRKRMAKSQSIKNIQAKGTPALDSETLESFRKSFQDTDKDNSGTISVAEFGTVYANAGVDLGPLADSMHARIDSDGDSRINFDEFVTHMAKVRVAIEPKLEGEEGPTSDGTTVGWRNDTKNVFQSAMACIGQSQSCRDKNKRFYEHVCGTIPVLAKTTQLAFRRKIAENSTKRDQLSARVSETQLELKQQGRCAKALQESIIEKREPLEVCRQRIAHRQTRPARELVRDQVTQVLEVEFQQLSDTVATLDGEMKQCMEEMKTLRASLKELQEGFEAKSMAIKIDNYCVSLRKKMEAAAKGKSTSRGKNQSR